MKGLGFPVKGFRVWGGNRTANGSHGALGFRVDIKP